MANDFGGSNGDLVREVLGQGPQESLAKDRGVPRSLAKDLGLRRSLAKAGREGNSKSDFHLARALGVSRGAWPMTPAGVASRGPWPRTLAPEVLGKDGPGGVVRGPRARGPWPRNCRGPWPKRGGVIGSHILCFITWPEPPGRPQGPWPRTPAGGASRGPWPRTLLGPGGPWPRTSGSLTGTSLERSLAKDLRSPWPKAVTS